MSYKIKKPQTTPQWSFLTNHLRTLLCLARDPSVRISDVSNQIGITQRAVQRILAELVEDEFLKISKEGRRNRYTINRKRKFQHPLEKHCCVGDLLKILT